MAETVFVVIQTYGVSGENDYASSVHLSREGARAKAKADCYMNAWPRMMGRLRPEPHDCDDRDQPGTCEGTWWEIAEWELLP